MKNSNLLAIAIKIRKKVQPARLIRPARLLGTGEYILQGHDLKVFFTRGCLAVRNDKKSSNQETGLGNRGCLMVLIDTQIGPKLA